MKELGIILILFLFCFSSKAQNPTPQKDSTVTVNDSIKRKALLKQLGNGYYPTRYIDLDLRYLIKFNQYEG